MRLKDFAKIANTMSNKITICIYDKNDKSLFTCYELNNYCISYYIARYPKLANQKIVYIHVGLYANEVVLNIVVNHRLYSYIENFEKTEERENRKQEEIEK